MAGFPLFYGSLLILRSAEIPLFFGVKFFLGVVAVSLRDLRLGYIFVEQSDCITVEQLPSKMGVVF